MILPIDITGSFRRTIYGRAGDQVKVISVHGCVTIVEDENGIRFPVSDEEMKIQGSDPIVITPAPATAKTNNKKSVPSKTIPPLPDQTSLF